jgi:alkyldihydroxyacetonephosphate synthase
MVLGSEGRLGILTEATVRVSPLPERENFHAVFFPDFGGGQQAVREIMQARLPLSMLRLSTPTETETTLALAGRERLIGAMERLLAMRGVSDEKAMLMLGFSGREGLVKASRKEAMAIVGKHGGVHVGQTFGKEWHKSRFRTPYLRNTLWDMGYAIDTLETAGDWSSVGSVLDAIETALMPGLEPLGERVHVFSHLSHLYPYGSSIYTTYLFRIADDPGETLQRWRTLKTAASEAIVNEGATISHQHGIGTDHMPYITPEKGPLGMAALADLCHRFDPSAMMNPGKLLPQA